MIYYNRSRFIIILTLFVLNSLCVSLEGVPPPPVLVKAEVTPAPKDAPVKKAVPNQFPLLERVKGKSSEQLKALEESFQRSGTPTEVELGKAFYRPSHEQIILISNWTDGTLNPSPSTQKLFRSTSCFLHFHNFFVNVLLFMFVQSCYMITCVLVLNPDA